MEEAELLCVRTGTLAHALNNVPVNIILSEGEGKANQQNNKIDLKGWHDYRITHLNENLVMNFEEKVINLDLILLADQVLDLRHGPGQHVRHAHKQ